ncbi:MAG: hypothetical protein ACRCYV_09130 [Aeromonas sp.]
MPLTDLTSMATDPQLVAACHALLEHSACRTQEEIRCALQTQGVGLLSQSTVSRLLRQLGAHKAPLADGRRVYQLITPLARPVPEPSAPPPTSPIWANWIRRIEAAHPLVIIHTQVGCAPAVAKQVENGAMAAVLGTIATQEVVFVAMRPGYRSEQATQAVAAALDYPTLAHAGAG